MPALEPPEVQMDPEVVKRYEQEIEVLFIEILNYINNLIFLKIK